MSRPTVLVRWKWSNVAWLYPLAFALGALTVRGYLSPEWAFLGILNVLAATVLVAATRHRPAASAWAWAIAIVLLVGGFFQLCWLGYKLNTDPGYVAVYIPQIDFLNEGDISRSYGEFTLLFVVFCSICALLVWTFSPVARHEAQVEVRSPSRLLGTLKWGTALYVVLTLWQVRLGFGSFGTETPAFPYHLTTIISFYRQIFFPSLLMLGLWVFDNPRDRRWWWTCLVGTAAVTAVEAYVSTSRGTVFTYGIPMLFLWYLCRRFAVWRRWAIIVGLVAYLIASPILTSLRSERLQATQIASGVALPEDGGFSANGIEQTLDHTIVRVGTAEGIITTMHYGVSTGIGYHGLVALVQPNYLTAFFTFEVVGLPRDSSVADFRSPTGLGDTILVGSQFGAVVVLGLLVGVIWVVWRWIVARWEAWPVAGALMCGALVSFFSDGAPVTLYKYAIGAAVIEGLYRWSNFRPSRPAPRLFAGYHSAGAASDPNRATHHYDSVRTIP